MASALLSGFYGADVMILHACASSLPSTPDSQRKSALSIDKNSNPARRGGVGPLNTQTAREECA